MPSDDFDMNASLSFSEIIDWRNRLKSGLSLVGVLICTLMEPPDLQLMEPVKLQVIGATRFAG